MALEIGPANQWLKAAIDAGLLAGGYSSVDVYFDVADEDAAYPLVVYSLVADPVTLKTGSQIAYAEPLYLVSVWARADVTSSTTLDAILSAVDSGITGAASSTISSHVIRGSWRDPRGGVAQRDPDTKTGIVYHQRGAYYRVFVQSP